MARFYFHLREDAAHIEDMEGVELPDLEAARAVAIKNARAIIAHDVLGRGVVPLDFVIEIADQDGLITENIAFRETISL